MSQNKVIFDKLIHKIRNAKHKEESLEISSALISSVSISVFLILVASILELIAEGDRTFRASLAIASLLLAGGVFVFNFRKFIYHRFVNRQENKDDYIALRVGAVYPELRDTLSNALQIFRTAETSRGTSPELAFAAFGNIAKVAVDKDFNAIIDYESHKKRFLIFFAIALVSILSFIVFPKALGGAFYRVAHFTQSFLPPAPFLLDISPLSYKAMKGDNIEIKVKINGKVPEKAYIFVKEEGQENFDRYELKKSDSLEYSFPIQSLKKSLEFYASAPWLTESVNTQVGRITVVDKPFIRSFSGDLINPAYSNLAPKRFDESSADISALRNARVNINLIASKDLNSARICFIKGMDSLKQASDTAYYNMQINGVKADGGFNVTVSGTYFIQIVDINGEQNAEPVKYKVISLDDLPPSISLLSPSGDARIGENALLAIKVAIADDYGFSGLKLKYKLVESKYAAPEKDYKSIDIPLLSNELTLEVPYLWDLNKLGISPEDKYEYYLEVYDNDRAGGPKSAKTQTLTVRLPSLEEAIESADKDQDKVQKDLEKIYKEADELKKEVEETTRQIQKKDKPLDWKEQKKLENIQKKQEELQAKLNSARESLEKTTQELQQNKALSEETMQKYMELQKLMQDVATPEMKQNMQKLQDAMKKMSPEQMKEALKNFQFNEEDFKKNIERTMKMLQRLQAEQKMDALAKRADEMEKKQDELAKQTENANPNDKNKMDELAKRQENLKDDLKDIKSNAKELEKIMKEIGKDMPLKQMSEMQKEMGESGMEQDMNDAQNEMKKGDNQKSKESQKSASKKMKKMASKMRDMKKEMERKSSKEAERQMKKNLDDMLELSKEQEKLQDATKSMDWNSTQFPKSAQKQADMKDALSSVINNMAALSQKSFAVTPDMAKNLGEALSQMQAAMDNLAGRNPQSSLKSQENAMAAMNSAAQKMQAAMAKMKGKGSCDNPGGEGEGEGEGESQGQGTMQKLQRLAAQQQAINQSMQQQMGQGGEQSAMQKQAEMGRLSKEQGSAQKSMEELAKEQKQVGGERKKGLGSLDKIAEDMKQTAREIEQGNITPETMKRQDRILSRLLDATRSMNDRDYEDKREAKSGKEKAKKSPAEIDLNAQEGKSKALQELLNSVRNNYNRDYETLIRLYFEKLQSNN